MLKWKLGKKEIIISTIVIIINKAIKVFHKEIHQDNIIITMTYLIMVNFNDICHGFQWCPKYEENQFRQD